MDRFVYMTCTFEMCCLCVKKIFRPIRSKLMCALCISNIRDHKKDVFSGGWMPVIVSNFTVSIIVFDIFENSKKWSNWVA